MHVEEVIQLHICLRGRRTKAETFATLQIICCCNQLHMFFFVIDSCTVVLFTLAVIISVLNVKPHLKVVFFSSCIKLIPFTFGLDKKKERKKAEVQEVLNTNCTNTFRAFVALTKIKAEVFHLHQCCVACAG